MNISPTSVLATRRACVCRVKVDPRQLSPASLMIYGAYSLGANPILLIEWRPITCQYQTTLQVSAFNDRNFSLYMGSSGAVLAIQGCNNICEL